MSTIIEVNNLSFEYEKGTPVLENVNTRFNEGRLIAILGKNGSGKSTFLDCLLGINEYKGCIKIKDKDLKKLSDKELSKMVAFIPQSVQINIDYQIDEFISFGRNPHTTITGKLDDHDYEIIENSAKRCEITHLLSKCINKVSGGERQLAFIARALVQETDVIIMDEPTASLDFGNQQKLFSIINDLVKRGKTIIFTTHNPNHLINIDCDIFVVKNKAIEKIDKIDNKILKDIYGTEFEEGEKAFLFKL